MSSFATDCILPQRPPAEMKKSKQVLLLLRRKAHACTQNQTIPGLEAVYIIKPHPDFPALKTLPRHRKDVHVSSSAHPFMHSVSDILPM